MNVNHLIKPHFNILYYITHTYIYPGVYALSTSFGGKYDTFSTRNNIPSALSKYPFETSKKAPMSSVSYALNETVILSTEM